MNVVLARVTRLSIHSIGGQTEDPYYSLSYVHKDSKNGKKTTGPVLLVIPKMDVKGSVKKGDIVEIISSDNEEKIEFRHLSLKQRLDILRYDMEQVGGFLTDSVEQPLSSFEKIAQRLLVPKKWIEQQLLERAVGKAA
jgi:hypothetical protein